MYKNQLQTGFLRKRFALCVLLSFIVVTVSTIATIGAAQETEPVTDTPVLISKVEPIEEEKEAEADIKMLAPATPSTPRLDEPEDPQPIVDESEEYDVPAASTGFKSFMDYRTITNHDSVQWEMQQKATTDELGFRRYDGFYMVAMGNYYADYECGNMFRITLTSGNSIDVIIGDVKSNLHTDSLHQHLNGNVVEFIVDSKIISDECKHSGDMSNAAETFTGNIEKIEALIPAEEEDAATTYY